MLTIMGSPSVQLIDILSSSDDEEMEQKDDEKPTIVFAHNGLTSLKSEKDLSSEPIESNESQASIQDSSQSNIINSSVCESPSQESIAESRRRKIDILLDNYERGQHRLKTVESMMNPAQKLRWLRLSNNSPSSLMGIQCESSNYNQVPSSSTHNSTSHNGIQRPPFQRPPWFIDPPGEVNRTVRTTTTKATTSRPYKKRVYKKKRRSTTRASTTKRTTKTASRTPAKARTASSARASTSYTSPAKTPRGDVKPRMTVKRES